SLGVTSREDFCAYMSKKVGSQELTFSKTSAGLTGGSKYVLRLGEENIGTFSMRNAVTGDLEIKFKRLVPYGVPLRLHCRLTQNKRMLFSGEGRLYLPDDTLAAVATARYRKLALTQISEFSPDGRDWSSHPREDDPEFIDLPLWQE
ncbi:MAG: hypothetical protein IKZ21_01160, partial [Clostridia bacterium]|nr:hypothetical protein [Clostridia bacterium]